jgi:hypothetical protein
MKLLGNQRPDRKTRLGSSAQWRGTGVNQLSPLQDVLGGG